MADYLRLISFQYKYVAVHVLLAGVKSPVRLGGDRVANISADEVKAK